MSTEPRAAKSNAKKVTTRSLRTMKQRGEKIAALGVSEPVRMRRVEGARGFAAGGDRRGL
jgi:hypothetical protein